MIKGSSTPSLLHEQLDQGELEEAATVTMPLASSDSRSSVAELESSVITLRRERDALAALLAKAMRLINTNTNTANISTTTNNDLNNIQDSLDKIMNGISYKFV